MTTVRDVAIKAGVSSSTVSHVLNETRWVSPELRARVLAATQDLGYEPNALARSLKTNRSHALGLIISDIGNPFFTSVVRGVEDVAQERGFSLILCNSDEDERKEETHLRLLASRRVDGLILVPSGTAHEYLASLVKRSFPIVSLDRVLPDLPISSVVIESERAAYEAVSHLIGLGHRRIAMIAGKPNISSTIERSRGYRLALQHAAIAVDEALIVSGASRMEKAREAADQLLDLETPPTAFFVGNNLMTIGTVDAIRRRGLRIPDDVALVGFDDFLWADVFSPRLTTVAQPTYELGRQAALLLMNRIADPVKPAQHTVLLGQLVIRDSSGARYGDTDDAQPV